MHSPSRLEASLRNSRGKSPRISYGAKSLPPSCTKILLTLRMRPAPIALNYSVKHIRNDVRQKRIIYEKLQYNSLERGSLTLAPMILHALQKQIGCFNNGVVTLVAGKQKRRWLCTVYFADYIRQPRGSFPNYLTTSIL